MKNINMKTKEECLKEAEEMLNRPQELANYLHIPTQLKEGSLNQKPEVHPKLANYDHSLDINRLPALRAKYDYVEVEHFETDDAIMTSEPYDGIPPADIPNLSGVFDNLFGI